MKTPQELELAFLGRSQNIKQLDEFLTSRYSGLPIKYDGKLTEFDIKYANANGWKVVKENNEAPNVMYQEWFMISAL